MDKKQLRQYKSTFHFGVSVRYEKVLWRGYGDREYPTELSAGKVEKQWRDEQVKQRIGVVVGWRWISNGVHSYSECGSYYTATQSIFTIEIKRGMLNKVDLVLPDQLTAHPGLYATIPDRIPTMSDRDKASLRNAMKSVPRDSKGRWK
jgi:hypothetical protein